MVAERETSSDNREFYTFALNGIKTYLHISVMGIKDHPAEEITRYAILSNFEGCFTINKVQFMDKIVLIGYDPTLFTVFDKAHDSGSVSQGSQVKYLGESKDREHRLQGTPPWTNSSLHCHEGPEIYRNVVGRQIVRQLNGATAVLEDSNPEILVPAWVQHQVQTLKDPSIALLDCDFKNHYYN